MAHSESKLPPDATVPQPTPATPDTLDSPNTNTDRKPPIDPSTADFLAPAQQADEIGRLGTYRVLSVIGKGGMGAVYRAMDPALKRQIALKVMLPQFAANELAKRRFLREAEAQAAVEHDHIITIYQVGEDQGVPFIAMPLLKGCTLSEALKKNPKPPLAHVLRIGREMAEGLAAAHEQGLMHRDIKPGNVWLEGKNLRVKILDFGLARAEQDPNADEHLTATGAILGTPHYMSPEQAHGHDVDHRTDLFSLGVVLYQMTTGKLPFTGSSTMAVLTSLATKSPPAPRSLNPQVPERLDRLIQTLLAKDPNERWQTAEDVAEELRQIEDEKGKTREVTELKAIPLPSTPSLPSDPWASIDATEPGALVRVTTPELKLAAKSAPPGKAIWFTIAIGLLIMLAGGAALYKFVFETPQGSLVVEIDDPEVEARFKNGELKLYDNAGKMLYTLKPQERDKKLPPGEYRIKVTGADGLKVDVPEFLIEKNGKATVRVSLDTRAIAKKPDPKPDPKPEPPGVVEPKEPPVAVAASDPHRRAAEAILKHGGTVEIRTAKERKSVKPSDNLPAEPFIITKVYCVNNMIPDDALQAFAGIPYLMNSFNLNTTNVTDRGIQHLRDMAIILADLGRTRITDASVALLSECPELSELALFKTRITDAAVPHLLKMTRLRRLHIGGTKITNAGLKQLANHPSLYRLELSGKEISASDLAHLSKMKTLQVLILWEFGDEVIEPLSAMSQLRVVAFTDTCRVTNEGARKLQENLPNAVIWHSANPPSDPEKKAIQWALDQKVSIDNNWKEVPARASSIEYFTMPLSGPRSGVENLKGIRCIARLHWPGLKDADAEAEHIATFDTLIHLELNSSDLTAKGLGRLSSIHSLEDLSLGSCSFIGDEAISHFPKFKQLSLLALSQCPVTDVGLETLGRLPALRVLKLAECTKITGAGIKHLAALPVLRELNLSKTLIDDTAIPNLKLLTQVRILYMQGTKITAAGIAELQKALPKCAIFWDGGLVVPGAPPIAVNRKADFTNSIGMEFVKVPKGSSWLGGVDGMPGARKVEMPNDFFLGKFEVTQGEWEAVMGKNPSHFSRTGALKNRVADLTDDELKKLPVEWVSWTECQEFVERLNKQSQDRGWTYRLPTPDEWEYACRGGPMTDPAESAFSYYYAQPTNQYRIEQANFGNGKADRRPVAVGKYEPNKLGLHDMHGNVWELCSERPHADKPWHVCYRGGCWNDDAVFGAHYRDSAIAEDFRGNGVGLRLIRVRDTKLDGTEKTAPADPRKADFTNKIGMEFMKVPKGTGWLGGGGGKPGETKVVIEQDFYLGKYEVTQEEWEKVMGTNPSHFSRMGMGKDAVKDIPDADLKRFPVEQVSWDDCQIFIKKLNEKENESGWAYRLPREAEWEYACRGGPVDKADSAFDFYFAKPTNTLLPEQANFNKILNRTCKVGSYEPNSLGMYDIQGNIWEWCEDKSTGDDGVPQRMGRGGHWGNIPNYCRAAHRTLNPPSHLRNILGLRLARVPVTPAGK